MGVPGGCEAVSHAQNGHVASVGDTTSLAILQVHLKNAFNTHDRSSILRQVAYQFPKFLRWVEFGYSQPSWLKFDNSGVLSARGISSKVTHWLLLFAVTIHPIIVALKNQFPDLACKVSYLDDGSLVGDVNLFAQVFPHLVSSMAKVGLEVSVEKCEACSPNPNLDFSAIPNVITVRSSGLKNLGAAISTNDDFIQALFLKRVENLMESIGRLEDPQLELHLLRSCAALPKTTFSMRTCDPFSISNCLAQFDNAVHLCLDSITGSALSPSQRLECSLPVPKGGLGLQFLLRLPQWPSSGATLTPNISLTGSFTTPRCPPPC